MGIEPVERDQAPPIVQRIYDAIEKRTGSVSPFFRMLGNNPEPCVPPTSSTGSSGSRERFRPS